MPRPQTLEDKVRTRIKNSKSNVFILNDFTDMASKNQICKVLRKIGFNGRFISYEAIKDENKSCKT